MTQTKLEVAKRLVIRGSGDKALGKRIRLARMYADMTQPALADRLGCGTELMSKIENGHSSPRVEMVVRAADILEVDADWLLTGKGSAR